MSSSHNRWNESRSGARTASRSASLKGAVLLLLAGLLSVAALAKHSFALPHSSPSHWVSQTCKMRQGPRATAPQSAVLNAIIVVRHHPCSLIKVFGNNESDGPLTTTAVLFRHLTLRAPPRVLFFP